LFAQDFNLPRELKLVGRVLIVTATADGKQAAGWRDALSGRSKHFEKLGVGGLGGRDANRLAGHYIRNQDHSIGPAREAFAAVNPLFDSDFVYDRTFPRTRMSLSPKKARVLSGIQPTGSPHIGNYLGALKNWARIQYDYDSIYCIVDLHAITVYQDPRELRAKIEELAGMLIALGIDPAHSAVVVQSMVPEHAELAWMLTCVTPVGWLERMTQYKAKSQAQETISDGLLQYPVLMAADILLYQANIVPVGEDQTQHLELARDIAQRFNSLYGEVFTMPETHLPSVGARIMGLDEPDKKMSKSAAGAGHSISLLDPPDVMRKKIMRATTDSNPAVDLETMGAGVRNLLTIFQAFSGWTEADVRAHFAGMRYGDLKKQVAEAVVAALDPIQKRYREITAEQGYVERVLEEGAERVRPAARDTLEKVKRAMGLYTSR
jgi:tryptophanyl-tRNA synthetase